MIKSVNYHLWEPCNMRCKFCFATFQDVKHSILPKGHLKREEAIEVVLQLASFGFKKITFAGGEPTLCPWLSELIAVAKEAGLTTMLVTNGTNLTPEFLKANQHHLDWIAVSVDSLCTETNLKSGRAITGKRALESKYYYQLADRIKEFGYGLKINTVVNSTNVDEDMIDFITYANPKRWKVLQVLPIVGQNELNIDDFKITGKQFQTFLDKHECLNSITKIVPEFNNQMMGTYAMVDPAGRFFDNAEGRHNYSRPILEIGAPLAIQQVKYSTVGFEERGGSYDWELNKKQFSQKITLSGEVASGKTTIGKLLVKELGYEFISMGLLSRQIAEEQEMSIVEFQEMRKDDPKSDKEMDKLFADSCNAKENLVIDYRLGYRFIENGFHVFLRIKEETAIERMKKAQRINETHLTVKQRNDTFKQQFVNAYNTDYTDEGNYNLVIDVEDFACPEDIVKHIISLLKNNNGNKSCGVL